MVPCLFCLCLDIHVYNVIIGIDFEKEYLDPRYSALGTSIPGGTILTLFLRNLRILPMLWVGLSEPQTYRLWWWDYPW
uniref:Uncharacterized protein n=1 Tax=Picea glauca TaxID=3330 RepID=A0A117NJ59_PICGL|nr:hypothetical protein ABT39_MTgene2275 [Picea glauca]KUM49862.1 hypothetical protein ABT39_MTgene3089 [Picea glauca]KUM51008.1 hypothetical protein ABT39_MTgene854 [Picea glauca]QHR87186.1 hypothetical protein Q903MT_gene1195 [Picea sitchensis]QHR88333.1 hypothetical protein Q903MT_gene2346 [Picea sitchensis]